LLMSYHGENHTDPAGVRLPKEGWSGIGLARWDPAQGRFVKIDQIVGLHASNIWRQTAQGWETEQAPPISSEGDMVLNPVNDMVYLYYGDKLAGSNPYSGIRIALAAIPLNTLCADAARGVHAPWLKWYRGSFSEPAVYTSSANAEHMPAGTGGPFTPLLGDGDETCPDVIYHGGRWYMVTSTGHRRLRLRTSSNGISWSTPRTVYAPRTGLVMYPYLWSSTTGSGPLKLTFTWQQAQRPWAGNFALEQLTLTP
jgi:hypothetical protein